MAARGGFLANVVLGCVCSEEERKRAVRAEAKAES